MNAQNKPKTIKSLDELDQIGNTRYSPQFTALAMQWSNPLLYTVQYAEICDDIVAGWFLSQFVPACPPNGEIALSLEEIVAKTRLTKRQWYRVRADLIKQEILINRRTSEQSFYSLNEDKWESALRSASITLPIPPLGVNRLHAVAFTHYGLSLKAVLLNAYLIAHNPETHPSEREHITPPILLNVDDIHAETYLTQQQISSALNELKKVGIVETERKGAGAYRYCRLNLLALDTLTQRYCNENQNQDTTHTALVGLINANNPLLGEIK